MAAPKKKALSPSAVKVVAKKDGAEAMRKPLATGTAVARVRRAKAKLISSKLAYQGRVFSVHTDTVREPNGTINQRDVIHHNGSIVVLAVDDSSRKGDPDVILIRQYRHAVRQYLLELPAGRIEAHERPLAAAKREMIEETGFRATKWTLLTRYFASPGFLGEAMSIFLAEHISEGQAKPEADEDIEVVRVRLSEAMALIAANQIIDGKTLIGLSLFDASRRAARRR